MTTNNILNQTLEQREARIAQVLEYIKQTQKLFEKHASSELKAAHGRFEPLIQGLQADKVRIVVIGEFSRGKSKLVNALLNIDLLPSAKEATTAINTFLQSPPAERRHEKYIQLNFIEPDRPSEELTWEHDGVLKQWGTELDRNNKNARSQLQHIDIFADHELLNKGLVIIDTPGLESVIAHHEEITRKAIASSHIAIWVQSVEQLGGNSQEWKFLTNTVRQHFRKFLTVVNMWDQVLEPEDDHDIAKPEAERVAEKMGIVCGHFRKHLSDLPETELAQIINDQHLMGVSAKWALSDEMEKRQKSGVDKLIQRIADLCNSGEAQQEIFYKPLKQLSSIQTTLSEALDDELNVLNDSRDIQDKQNELALLEQEIKNQQLEQSQTAKEFKDEHYRAAQVISKQINENLVQPLRSLRDEIDILLTESYIKRKVEAGYKNIGLPDEAQEKFEKVTESVNEAWTEQTQQIETALNDLKSGYIKALRKHSLKLQQALGNFKIDLPEIDIDLQLDLSGVIAFQTKKWELEKALEKIEQEIYENEVNQARFQPDESKLNAAREEVKRKQRQLDNLGSQPSPYEYRVNTRGKVLTWLFGEKNETRYDYSNVDAYCEKQEKLQIKLEKKEEILEKLIAKEVEKAQQRQTLEVSKRKAEQRFEKMMKEYKEQEKKEAKEKEHVIADTLRHLRNSTTGELNNRIRFLEKNASQMIEQLFDDQLKALLACVEEQFTQPLLAKQAKRAEVLELFEHSKNEVEQRKTDVMQAKKELCEVMEFTQHALNS